MDVRKGRTELSIERLERGGPSDCDACRIGKAVSDKIFRQKLIDRVLSPLVPDFLEPAVQ